MVDKIWYQWQLRSPSNKNAFSGGTISVQVDPTAPPNGGPPFLNVRSNSFWLTCTCSDGADVQQLTSEIPGDGLWNGVTIQDVMDTQGGKLCYIYA